MAYHLIDGSAHAFWETFKIQRGGDGVVPGGLFVDPAVDLLRGDPFPDPSGHIVQDRHVHFGALPDGRDLCGLLDHTAGGDNLALIAVPGQLRLRKCMEISSLSEICLLNQGILSIAQDVQMEKVLLFSIRKLIMV